MSLLTPARSDVPREQTISKAVYPYPPRRKFDVIQPRAIHKNFRTPLDESIDDIDALLTWPEEWDGYQVAPSLDAVRHAHLWIQSLYEDVEDVSTGSQAWVDPLVVADAHRNVVFEWLKDNNRLVVYVSPHRVEYLKVWGPDIWTDMEDGTVETPEERWALWRWLMG
jgi:hypothetical protein